MVAVISPSRQQFQDEARSLAVSMPTPIQPSGHTAFTVVARRTTERSEDSFASKSILVRPVQRVKFAEGRKTAVAILLLEPQAL